MYEFFFKRPDIDKIFREVNKHKQKFQIERPEVDSRPFLHYLEMMQRRNIFNPIELKNKNQEKEEVSKEKLLSELTKDLILVGISWGKKPLAMIEDKKLKKTYFLNEGDKINNFTISKITPDAVLLTYDGKEVEL